MTTDDILMVALAAAGTDRGVRTDAQRIKAALAAVAPLIAAAERDACAKVADEMAAQNRKAVPRHRNTARRGLTEEHREMAEMAVAELDACANECDAIAAAIRARRDAP